MTDTNTSANKLIERLFSAGAHFGYSRSKRHPSVAPFIYGAKNNTEVFDLERTAELLEEAKAYMEKLGSERKLLLFVGGKSEAQAAVKVAADTIGMPYVCGRWIGGTLTNFPEIKKRIERLETLRSERDKGELEKRYTKKERLLIDREIARLEERFSGIVPIKERAPDVMVLVDTKHEDIALREARARGIATVGIGNSDCDVRAVDHAIVANDSSAHTISLLLGELIEAYQKGLTKADAPSA